MTPSDPNVLAVNMESALNVILLGYVGLIWGHFQGSFHVHSGYVGVTWGHVESLGVTFVVQVGVGCNAMSL